MNYIDQIKGFWLTQEVNQLGTSEIAMYFHLLEIWNKTGWIDTFKRNNYKVMADLSIKSYKTLQSVRDRLQHAGILQFKQRNGDANVEYAMSDLSKFYRGSVKGSSEGLRQGSSKGEGEGSRQVNINQTKPDQTKHSKSHSGDKSPPQKKDPFENVEHWKIFVDTWDQFYEKRVGEKYVYQKKDFGCLKKIYNFLKKRSEQKKFEWNEENLIAAFKFFLQKAWEKDEWMKQNFTIPNVLSQFNQIANGTGKTNSQNGKQPTGANVSTGSILSKINSMPG